MSIDTATGDSNGEPAGFSESEAKALGWKAPATLWDFVQDLYFYEGGFADNSYLLPHSREKFYWQRKQETTLRNYFKPIIDATILPVFNKPIARTIEDNLVYEAFAEDCTGGRQSLTDFIEDAVTLGRIYPCFVVMDNDSSAGEKSATDAIAERDFPYVYIRRPQSVKRYSTDKFGNLVSICFCEGKHTDASGKETELYVEWSADKVAKLTIGSDGKETTLSMVEHGLGAIPVFPIVFGKSHCDSILTQPEFIGIARLNYALYNVDSEARDIARNGRFPTMYAYGIGSNASGVSVGVHSLIVMDDPAMPAPGILQPDVRIMEDGRKEAADIVASIYQLAQQSGVTGVVSSESGVAKQWDFQAHSAVLSKTARVAEAIDLWCAYMFGLYTNTTITVSVKYPNEFAPTSADDTINRLANATLMDWPEPVRRYLKGKIFEQISAGDDSEEANIARESLKEDSIGDPAVDAGEGDNGNQGGEPN